jgi:hypothetical protein
MDINEALERSAQLLAEKGWTQHQCTDSEGRVCLIEALYEADEENWGRASDYLGTLLGGSVIDWNDRIGRTAPEVIAKLHEAADLYVSVQVRLNEETDEPTS